jgi:hypothetical protein
MAAQIKPLTGDDEIDRVIKYLRECHKQGRSARLNAENVDALIALLDTLFAASSAIPAVQAALVDLLDVANTDKLIKLLVRLDPGRQIERLAKVAA